MAYMFCTSVGVLDCYPLYPVQENAKFCIENENNFDMIFSVMDTIICYRINT